MGFGDEPNLLMKIHHCVEHYKPRQVRPEKEGGWEHGSTPTKEGVKIRNPDVVLSPTNWGRQWWRGPHTVQRRRRKGGGPINGILAEGVKRGKR